MMRIDENNVFHDDYFCPSYDVDRYYKANLGLFLKIVQDVAANHSYLRGCSIPHLMREGKTWVILRNVLEIRSYPSWPSHLEVLTWPMPYRGRCAPRGTNFLVGGTGDVLAICHSDWCVLDLQTRRPVRPDFIAERLPNVRTGGHLSLPESPVRTPRYDDFPPGASELVRKITPQPHESDYNGHINNIPYVNWMMNALSTLVSDDYLVSRIDVSWLKETFLSDHLEVRLKREQENENSYLAKISREGEAVCVAEIRMRGRGDFPEL